MSFLSSLKAILSLDASKLKHVAKVSFSKLINVNVNVNVDRSYHIHGDTLIVDHSKLDPKQYAAIKKVLRDEGLPEAKAILEAQSEQTVETVRKALPSHEGIVKKLTPLLSPRDISLLWACIYLRGQSQQGAPVDKLKTDILRVYGQRGANFANLCTAGYLENWAYPLYEELLNANPDQPELAKSKFRSSFNETLINLPFTEFVSSQQTAEEAKRHIVGKILRNRANGIFTFEVHAFGFQNVKKVERVLANVRKEIGSEIKVVEQTETRISARLQIKKG